MKESASYVIPNTTTAYVLTDLKGCICSVYCKHLLRSVYRQSHCGTRLLGKGLMPACHSLQSDMSSVTNTTRRSHHLDLCRPDCCQDTNLRSVQHVTGLQHHLAALDVRTYWPDILPGFSSSLCTSEQTNWISGEQTGPTGPPKNTHGAYRNSNVCCCTSSSKACGCT